uniref:Lipase n=1 Tax=Timema bartmani TaxID=61472 RepID=A0A7R9ESC2_9NEOP|nr:unnamed protein product [Timema bartmani]
MVAPSSCSRSWLLLAMVGCLWGSPVETRMINYQQDTPIHSGGWTHEERPTLDLPTLPDKADFNMPTPNLARKYGYLAESHKVKTQDGYLLTVHRIPGIASLDHNFDRPRPAVLLQHGLLCSSAEWVMLGINNALAYKLVDNGFDVWMGNARGNTYSQSHVSESVRNFKFWEFSWDEMGRYDLPAVVDYILSVTGQKELFYIGHSMGCTMFFVMCATHPEYNSKIRHMFAMAPVAFMSAVNTPFKALIPISRKIWSFTKVVGVSAWMHHDFILRFMTKYKCELPNWRHIRMCRHGFPYMYSVLNSTTHSNASIIPLVQGHTPAGTSLKVIIHFGQLSRSGRFNNFDYGLKNNVKRYQNKIPPDYNLTKIITPMTLLYSDSDWLANSKDVTRLAELLPSAVTRRVPSTTFTHTDFVYGATATTLVYDNIIQSMLGGVQ